MDTLTDTPGESLPDSGVTPAPPGVRGRVDLRLMLSRDMSPADGGPWKASDDEISREALAPHKRTRRLEFADPSKTVSGEIRRIAPRERTAQGDGGAEYLEENHR
ncbi:hypothetical protein [Streptomyces sp. NPDC059008]|uniref:hypothetical protein n=1 Tax=Streptomyces sp. NPDC059008 TaxID=3346693 RepID=UPI00367823C8